MKRAVALQRTFGEGRVFAKTGIGGTRLDRLYQNGACKIRLPKTYDKSLEAVLINTAGGLTGGDNLSWQVVAGAGTHLTVTSQACEKIYQSRDGVARILNHLKVEEDASLLWLPQETILFNECGLERALDVEIEPHARFLGLEAGMIGRRAMGEKVTSLAFHDRWRISRDGRLIFADDFRLGGILDKERQNPALLNGYDAFATLFYHGPESQEELALLVQKLQGIAHNQGIGISVLEGTIVIRMLARDCYFLRQTLIPLITMIRDALNLGASVPKVWTL